MLVPKLLLFGFAIGQIGVVTILVIYSIVTLLKIRSSEVSAQQGCAILNAFTPITVLIHGCTSFLLMLHGRWLLFTMDLLILHWTIPLTVMNRNKGVFDAKNILNAGKVSKYIRNHYIYLLYLAMCLAVYIKHIIEGFNTPMEWGAFGLAKSFLFVSTVCLIEVALGILIYSLAALMNIELDNSCAKDVCQILNRLLVVKTIVHGVLTCALTAHTSWAFFISNLQILRYEICKIDSERGTNLDVYDPEKIIHPNEIYRHRSYNKTCFLYFCACLGIYMYCLLVNNIGVGTSTFLVVIPMLLMEIHQMLTEEWGICSVLRFSFYLFSGKLRARIRNYTYFFMHFLEWSIVLIYWNYLSIFKENWILKEHGDSITYMLINVFYDMGLLLIMSFAVLFIQHSI